jgi:hypothetical protein
MDGHQHPWIVFASCLLGQNGPKTVRRLRSGVRRPGLSITHKCGGTAVWIQKRSEMPACRIYLERRPRKMWVMLRIRRCFGIRPLGSLGWQTGTGPVQSPAEKRKGNDGFFPAADAGVTLRAGTTVLLQNRAILLLSCFPHWPLSAICLRLFDAEIGRGVPVTDVAHHAADQFVVGRQFATHDVPAHNPAE